MNKVPDIFIFLNTRRHASLLKYSKCRLVLDFFPLMAFFEISVCYNCNFFLLVKVLGKLVPIDPD